MRRFALLLPIALVLVGSAGAAAPGVQLALTNRPGVTRLAVNAAAGSLISGSVTATSTASVATSLTLAAADAKTAPRTGERFVTTAQSGGTLSGVGSWLHLTQTQIGVGPHGHTDVGFSVAVPAGTKPGQYVGGIVALQTPLAVTLVITVPGAATARFAIGGAVARSPHVLAIHIANEGDLVRRPTGTVAIANGHGTTVATKAFRMADFLPHSAVDFPIVLARPLAVGSYVATVRLTYPAADGTPQTASAAPRLVVSPAPVVTTPKPTKTVTAATTSGTLQTSTNWWGVFGVVLAAVALLGGISVAVRRRRAASAAPVRHSGPHYWQVDWERRDLDSGGALRHLHRCRDCGAEVMARDVREASLSSR